MRLRRNPAPPRLISLVSMIDVLLIMLVFFMVTSTYLDLDMIPVVRSAEDAAGPVPSAAPAPVLIRLADDGAPILRGRRFGTDDLMRQLDPLPDATPVLILPSPRAGTQALVAVMDAATRAGVTSLRIVQPATP